MSCVFVYVFCVDILGFVNMVVVVFIYFSIYLSIYLYTYGWYAMNYDFMHLRISLCSEIHRILVTKCYGIYLAENCCFLVELIQRGLSPEHLLLLHHQESPSETNNIPERVGKLTLRLTLFSWSTDGGSLGLIPWSSVLSGD